MRHSIIRATFGAIALVAATGHALAQAALDFPDAAVTRPHAVDQ